jgi:uncharacterized protein (TIGR03086 family)
VPIDLEPAAATLSRLVVGVRDDDLGAPTPCPRYSVGDLLDHVGGLAVAFTLAARKEPTGADGPPPPGDAARLGPDWRERIPRDLRALGAAWRDPDAWTGMTAAGGVDMPAEIGGVVALDEIVVHGWDLARAVGVEYRGDPAALAALDEALDRFPMASPDARGDGREAFGPPVAVAADAPVIDRIVGRVGRDPDWAPA